MRLFSFSSAVNIVAGDFVDSLSNDFKWSLVIDVSGKCLIIAI